MNTSMNLKQMLALVRILHVPASLRAFALAIPASVWSVLSVRDMRAGSLAGWINGGPSL